MDLVAVYFILETHAIIYFDGHNSCDNIPTLFHLKSSAQVVFLQF
jgi:hypothetical protein